MLNAETAFLTGSTRGFVYALVAGFLEEGNSLEDAIHFNLLSHNGRLRNAPALILPTLVQLLSNPGVQWDSVGENGSLTVD